MHGNFYRTIIRLRALPTKMNIAGELEKALSEPSDIVAHAGALVALSKGKLVVEFGTRDGVSTRLILGARPLALTCYDLERADRINDFYVMCAKEGTEFSFKQQDIDKLDKIPDCDFVFCDACHNGNAVIHQLQLAWRAGAQTIAIHDTELFGKSGDLPDTPGINEAIDAFISAQPNWKIAYHSPESFGLTVLTCLDPKDTAVRIYESGFVLAMSRKPDAVRRAIRKTKTCSESPPA
jgi:cephalosporin hydroxylase